MEKTYKIEVDCANCAATIERHVAKLKCVKEVTVSYMAQKMLVEYAPGVDETEAKAEILKTALKTGTGPITFFYANRSENDVIFAAELRELLAANPGRLTLVHWLESLQGLPSARALATVFKPNSLLH